MLDHFSPPLTTVLEEPVPGGALRLGLDVRAEGVTFLAQFRLSARPGAWPTSTAGGIDVEQAASRQLDTHRGWARGFLERVREQLRPVVEAETCRVIVSLTEENDRLREALADCVDACGEALEQTDAAGLGEGDEGDQARAWLALDRAREVLESPLTLPPLSFEGRRG